MTSRERGAEEMLGALGELQRLQRAELEHFETAACELAEREPERMQAFEARLVRELSHGTSRAARAVTLKPRRMGRAFSLAALTCAAAALLWARAPATFDIQYTLVPPAADAVTRGPQLQAAGGPYTLGRTLTFLLRPAVRYSGPLHVSAFAAHGETLVQLEPTVELDPAGGARVILATGPGSQLTSEGSWQLQFIVSPAAVSGGQLHARSCPADTRCLTFSARFVQPQNP